MLISNNLNFINITDFIEYLKSKYFSFSPFKNSFINDIKFKINFYLYAAYEIIKLSYSVDY